MQRNRFSNLHKKGFMEVIPSKRIVNVALPPRFIVENYDENRSVYWDGFFRPDHIVVHFQIDVINDNKRRRYYGQHYDVDNSTIIYDIFHNKQYVFDNNEYQNLLDLHGNSLSRYHKMLIEFYIQP